MSITATVSFDGLDHSAAIEERVQEKAAKLQQFCRDMLTCRVVISRYHKNKANAHRKGEPYRIAITVKVPGAEMVVKGNPDEEELREHEDLGVALRDAFQAMERQLKSYAERRH